MSLVEKLETARLIYVKITAKPDLSPLVAFAKATDRELIVSEYKPGYHTKADIKVLKAHTIFENKIAFLCGVDDPEQELIETFDIISELEPLAKAMRAYHR